jgi:hypothetical protein
MEILIPVVVVVALVFGILGSWIAGQKRKDGGEGFILGLIFGPIGVIIEAVLPTPAQTPPSAPAAELTNEEQDRVQEQRRKQAAQEQAKQLAAARELEEWRKARIEQMRSENEERARRWREAKAIFVRSQKALWREIPDWAKMTAVGLLIGLVVCTPLFIFWPNPLTPPPDGEPVTSKPQRVVAHPPPAVASQLVRSQPATSSERVQSRVANKVTISASDKFPPTWNPSTLPPLFVPRFKVGDRVVLYNMGSDSVLVAKDADTMKQFYVVSEEARQQFARDGRLFFIPLGSLGEVTEIDRKGVMGSICYGVRSLQDPSRVVFVSHLDVIPASKELEDIPDREERVRYLERHPDSDQAMIQQGVKRADEPIADTRPEPEEPDERITLSILSQSDVKPRITYDKFDDVTVISTVLGKIPGCDAKKSDITLIISHPGKQPKRFDNGWLQVTFSRSDESFEWNDDILKEVKMMCGDAHIPTLLPATYWSKAYPAINTCTETFSLSINLKKSKELLKTNKDWDVRIDYDDPFVLDAKYRAKMLAFIKFLEEGKG